VGQQGLEKQACCNSLYLVTGLYHFRSDGSLQYNGHRPGVLWHAHGYFPKRMYFLEAGEVVIKIVYKRRWLLFGSTQTCHSRPPDDALFTRFCSLIIFCKLWSWVGSAHGVTNRTEIFPSLNDIGCTRTLQRWLKRIYPHALEIQQNIRHALIQRSEPRPLERLFPGGLSPPRALLRRPWRASSPIVSLWRAFSMLIIGATKLDVSVSILLAEARTKRNTQQGRMFP